MGIDPLQFEEMQRRVNGNFKRHPVAEPGPASGQRVEREDVLHRQIMEWCDAQWPRWKYVRARPDVPSTIAKGAQDFTVFGPHPLVVLVECKKKDGKVDPDQRIWAAQMAALGWAVAVVRSLAEFHAAVAAAQEQLRTPTKAQNPAL